MNRGAFQTVGWWKTSLIGVLLLVTCVVIPPATARVFRFLGPADNPELNNGRYGWESAYTTRMTVNGRPSQARLYSVRFSDPVLDQLKTRFEEQGAKVSMSKSPGGATGVAVWPDEKEARFMVLSPASEPRHLVFVFYPEPGRARAEVAFPVPKYPGGVVEQTVQNDDTHTFYATLFTMADATEAHTFYSTALANEGWRMLTPALIRDGSVSGMAVYQKGQQVCYVQAVNRPGRSNAVTLLVKGGKL